MNKTVIIVFIAVLSVAAICLLGFIAVMPEPVEPIPTDPHTPNSLASELEITRQEGQTQERMMAIKTYQGEIDTNDLIKIAKLGGLEYYELDSRSNDYLLIVPFEINGKMTIYDLRFDEKSEAYVANNPVFKCNEGKELPNNYSLLLRYSRPAEAEYQIDLVQADGAAGYQIANMEVVDKFGKNTSACKRVYSGKY